MERQMIFFILILLSAVNAANRPIRKRYYNGDPSAADTPTSCDSDSVVSSLGDKCLTYYQDCTTHNGEYMDSGDLIEGRLIFSTWNGHTLDEYWDTLAALHYACLFNPAQPYVIRQKGTTMFMNMDCMSLRTRIGDGGVKQLCRFERRPLGDLKLENLQATRLDKTGSLLTFRPRDCGYDYGVFPFSKEFFASIYPSEPEAFIRTSIKSNGTCFYSEDGLGMDQNDQHVKEMAHKDCRYGAHGELICRAQGINGVCEYNLKHVNPHGG